jgi:hypothetical protein
LYPGLSAAVTRRPHLSAAALAQPTDEPSNDERGQQERDDQPMLAST